MIESETRPDGDVALRTIAMPADANAYGDIFGGWLLSQMDLAAASFALERAAGRVVTVGIEAMTFHKPVFVGDQISCYCRIERIGRTSITVHVEIWARRLIDEKNPGDVRVTQGMFTFVAIDAKGNKRELPEKLRADPGS